MKLVKGQRESSAGRELALHAADPDSIPGTPYDLSPTRSDPEHHPVWSPEPQKKKEKKEKK